MTNPDDEIKRLQRIRDQQLAARKPSEKRDRYFKEYHTRHPGQKPMTLKEIITVFSNKLRGLVIGALAGVVIWLALPLWVEEPTATIIGIAAIVVLGVVGIVIGASFDWRDEIKKL